MTGGNITATGGNLSLYTQARDGDSNPKGAFTLRTSWEENGTDVEGVRFDMTNTSSYITLTDKGLNIASKEDTNYYAHLGSSDITFHAGNNNSIVLNDSGISLTGADINFNVSSSGIALNGANIWVNGKKVWNASTIRILRQGQTKEALVAEVYDDDDVDDWVLITPNYATTLLYNFTPNNPGGIMEVNGTKSGTWTSASNAVIADTSTPFKYTISFNYKVTYKTRAGGNYIKIAISSSNGSSSRTLTLGDSNEILLGDFSSPTSFSYTYVTSNALENLLAQGYSLGDITLTNRTGTATYNITDFSLAIESSFNSSSMTADCAVTYYTPGWKKLYTTS